MSVLSRLSPEHRQKFATPLKPEHAEVLKHMLSAGLLRRAVDPETQEALLAAGYGRHMAGGFGLTEEGRARAMLEQD